MNNSREVVKLSILGSTGSIGIQTLQVIEQSRGKFEVLYLTTNRNIDLLYQQVQKFAPKGVVIRDYDMFKEFKKKYNANIKVFSGEDALDEVAASSENDLVVSAIVGFSGVKPTISALASGKNVALANKESIVVAGEIITEITRKYNSKIISIDSEHNAILQCLVGENLDTVEEVILTASGGPFLNTDPKNFEHIQIQEALAHPRWSMGKKISIDSATLMNKGLEVIEAHWLFNLETDKIKVLIHPESIIHSMVQFIDGSIKAQLGPPDMRIPISFALNYPNRFKYDFPRINLAKIEKLSFFEPNHNKFPCLRLAYDALAVGGSAPIVLNASNEIAVNAFLGGKITFDKIPACIEFALNKINNKAKPSLEEIYYIDKLTREITESFINNLN
ncbi:MAG: 1-deoxy-D-xylulose-5-phosphate reductoisomerase [Ignavibacteria bacterium]|nr:1-deoxy-D-xylulose-5-phosphate reductoisomerase [Ignavibacteria bacterium]